MNSYKLKDDVRIPALGLGTWQLTDRAIVQEVIEKAVDCGYRLIDTAAAYGNEIAIGKAIKNLNINRKELFISDKVWNSNRGYYETQEACKKSLKKLKIEYLDAYLIHWPASMKLHRNWAEINYETWRAMEKLYKDGYARCIGVCNFKIHHLEKLRETSCVMPMINQMEVHPGMFQKEILDYCKKQKILVEASSPLGNGQILDNSMLQRIAEQHQKSVAQICLRWELDKGLVVLPKSANTDRINANFQVFDFTLTEEERKLIDSIPFCGGIRIDSDEVVEFG